MKKMLLYVFLTLVFTLLFSCKGFYFVKNNVSNLKKMQSLNLNENEPFDVFPIDSNSMIYVRKLYLKSNQDSIYNQITTISSNKENPLIEVQYFIFNNNKVLYISTIPSKRIYDKTDTYLLNTREGKIQYPNAFYFNSFYFGQIKGGNDLSKKNDTIEFKNEKSIFRWNISFTSEHSFTINSIDSYKLKQTNLKKNTEIYLNTIVTDYSQNNPLKFSDNYRYGSKNYFNYLSYKKPSIDNVMNDSIINDSIIKYPKSNALFIVYKDKSRKKVKEVIIPFEENLFKSFNEIKFKGKRVKFIQKI